MKYLIAITAAALLAGCSTPRTYGEITQDEFVISVKVDPRLPSWGISHRHMQGDTILRCEIILKRYPACLLHEIRHCLEGNFHPGTESSEDC